MYSEEDKIKTAEHILDSWSFFSITFTLCFQKIEVKTPIWPWPVFVSEMDMEDWPGAEPG